MTNINKIEADSLIADPNTFVLDVRTPMEFKAVSLPRATLIPIDQLALRLDELPQNKSQNILIYCAHGRRSVHGSILLEQNGFTNVINLQGGLAAYFGESF